MNTVGVVMAYDLPSVTSDPYLGPVLDGILEANKRHHQKTVLFTEDDWRTASENVPVYCDGHCDGLLLIAPRTDSSIVTAMKESHRPFVLVGDSREDDDVTVVDVDNVGMSRALTEHLLEMGRRRIAILCGNSEFTSNSQRMKGYRMALEHAGIEPDPRLMLPGQYWEWSGYENTCALLKLPVEARPDALFCSNGRVAAGALRALDEHGLRVPDDIAVAACCERAEGGLEPPRVSAAYMPVRRIGQAAVEALLSMVHAGRTSGARTILPAERMALTPTTG
jgi:LacI family transcriptional regulator